MLSRDIKLLRVSIQKLLTSRSFTTDDPNEKFGLTVFDTWRLFEEVHRGPALLMKHPRHERRVTSYVV